MYETDVYYPLPAIDCGATKLSLSLPILAVMLGLLLLEPASPQLSLMHLARPLFPFLGGVSCISALRIVLPVLFCPDSD
jgi:hypothetical protein